MIWFKFSLPFHLEMIWLTRPLTTSPGRICTLRWSSWTLVSRHHWELTRDRYAHFDIYLTWYFPRFSIYPTLSPLPLEGFSIGQGSARQQGSYKTFSRLGSIKKSSIEYTRYDDFDVVCCWPSLELRLCLDHDFDPGVWVCLDFWLDPD